MLREERLGLAGLARTAADGSFAFSSLRAGTYELAGGSALAGFGTLAGVPTGGADVVLRLAPGGRVRVRAMAADGTAIEGAHIHVQELDGELFRTGDPGARTDPDGVAEILAPPGVVGIGAHTARLAGRAEVVVASGRGSTVEITLSEEPPRPAP
jgi:hypothetical protein